MLQPPSSLELLSSELLRKIQKILEPWGWGW